MTLVQYLDTASNYLGEGWDQLQESLTMTPHAQESGCLIMRALADCAPVPKNFVLTLYHIFHPFLVVPPLRLFSLGILLYFRRSFLLVCIARSQILFVHRLELASPKFWDQDSWEIAQPRQSPLSYPVEVRQFPIT